MLYRAIAFLKICFLSSNSGTLPTKVITTNLVLLIGWLDIKSINIAIACSIGWVEYRWMGFAPAIANLFDKTGTGYSDERTQEAT